VHLLEHRQDLKFIPNSATKVHHKSGELSSFSYWFQIRSVIPGRLSRGVGVEHPALIGCNSEISALVVVSVLY
jgi:hypothetical protein